MTDRETELSIYQPNTEIKNNSFEHIQPGDRILFVSDVSDGGWQKNHGGKPVFNGVDTFSRNITSSLWPDINIDFLHPFVVNEKGEREMDTVSPMFYSDLPVVLNPFQAFGSVMKRLEQHPNGVFIATPELPLGRTTLFICQQKGIPHTVAYTTKADVYIEKYSTAFTNGFLTISAPVARHLFLRHLYPHAERILVPTEKMRQAFISDYGHEDKIVVWRRGVNKDLFRPPYEGEENPYKQYEWYREKPGIVFVTFGRVSVEKNIPNLFALTPEQLESRVGRPYHMVVIGSGPQLEEYKEKWQNRPDIHFLGYMPQEVLARYIRFSDYHLFPSKTDTNGNVILEAAASGVPTLGYGGSEIGSSDNIVNGKTGVGVTEGDIWTGLPMLFAMGKEGCAQYARTHIPDWKASACVFMENIRRMPAL